jgi:hypothetical protein
MSAARSVVRSNRKCKVGTVWMCRRLNKPLRKKPAACVKAARVVVARAAQVEAA